MKTVHDMGRLQWQVSGIIPRMWRRTMKLAARGAFVDVPPIAAPVPGSVQRALRDAGQLDDWYAGRNARHADWVENRDWLYETVIPDAWLAPGATVRLRCNGLDYRGVIGVNRTPVAAFENGFVPHVVDLTPHLAEHDNTVQILFEPPPRWLGQTEYTSRITDWKARFNYGWDWMERVVQVGIWDDISLEVVDGPELGDCSVETGFDPQRGRGSLRVSGPVSDAGGVRVAVTLLNGDSELVRDELPAVAFARDGVRWTGLEVAPWWPNLAGEQPLYTLRVDVFDRAGALADRLQCRVGFRRIEWRMSEGAPQGAEPWLCVVNDTPLFLQGINWVPVRPTYADVTVEDYRLRLAHYRDMGVNIIRVWGGGVLEKEMFYNLCDEYGLMVWQEFPLSSSGLDNYPPDDRRSIEQLSDIAVSYITRRRHHVSLAVWCGGNELVDDKDGDAGPYLKPLGAEHLLISTFRRIVQSLDAARRFLPTSPFGPRYFSERDDFGKGLHWDVHGPWRVRGTLEGEWLAYWRDDDAIIHTECGAIGPCSVELIRTYKTACGGRLLGKGPANGYGDQTWGEWDVFRAETGREPDSLEEYVEWGQARQAEALRIMAHECKRKFPRCTGVVLWMGHDSYPRLWGSAVIEFDGRPKPAFSALQDVFRTPLTSRAG